MKECILNYYNNLDRQYLDKDQVRFEWVDICKGILINFVILGHSSNIMAPYVYLFHIPLFFLLAGYVESIEEKSMLQIFTKKFVSLIIPYFAVNIIFLLIRVGMNLFNVQGLFYNEIISTNQVFQYVKRILQVQWVSDLGGATWFLFCLFMAFLLAKLVCIVAKKWGIILGVVLYVIPFWLNSLKITLPYYIDVACIGAFYILLGNFCKKYNVFDYLTFINWKRWIIIFIVYCALFSSVFHCSLDWASRSYGEPILSFVSVALAMIILMNLSKSIQVTKMGEKIKFYGQESLSLMLMHFLIFRMIYLLMVALDIYPIKVLRNLTPPEAGFANLLYLPVTLVVFKLIHTIFKKVPVYKWIFEGKIKIPQLVKNGTWNKYSVIVLLLVVGFLVYNIPFLSIVNKTKDMKREYYLEGVYEDDFIGKEFSIKLNIKKQMHISFQLYNPLMINGTCEIYYDDQYHSTYSIKDEIIYVELHEIDAEVSEIRMVFSNTVVPSEMETNSDERELSVMLVDGAIKMEKYE